MSALRRPRALTLRGWTGVVGLSRAKVIELLVQNGAQVAAVVSVVLLFAAGTIGQLAGVAVGVLSSGLAAWLLRRSARRRPDLIGAYVGVRLLLLIAATGALLARRPDEAGWIWLGTGLALLAVLVESSLRAMISKTQPFAVHVPGLPTPPEPPFPAAVLPWATLAVTALGWLLALIAAPGWLHLLAGLVSAGLAATLVVQTGRANLATRRAATGLRPALVALQPAFVVYYAAVQGARYQLGMWLPYLERLGVPFVVITRSPDTLPVIASLTSAPVLVPQRGSTFAQLDKLVVPSMKAAFYVQGSAANSAFQRYRQITHVWLNHGDSDKAANFNARHASYDKLFVSGQQGVERYAAHGVHVPPEKFVKVGRPQIERIRVQEEPLPPGSPRTVLYAPTWRGGRPSTNYSSLPVGQRVVEALLARGATVIFRPHPLTYQDPDDTAVAHLIQQTLAADSASTGRGHLWGPAAESERDIPACINAVDALVTDVSSVASDFLASGKPLAMVAIQNSGQAFREQNPMARVSYVIEKDLSTLDAALDLLLDEDPLREQRLAYRRHCLGDHLGEHAADEFLRVAGAIVRGER